jgi:hypothetical protein
MPQPTPVTKVTGSQVPGHPLGEPQLWGGNAGCGVTRSPVTPACPGALQALVLTSRATCKVRLPF